MQIFMKKLRFEMIQAVQATKYIANGIKKLLQSGEINGDLDESKTSISIYLRSDDVNNPPPKYFRGSNHHPRLSNLLGHNWKPWN